MEQLAARWAHNPKVGGSSPPPATLTVEFRFNRFFVFISASVALKEPGEAVATAQQACLSCD